MTLVRMPSTEVAALAYKAQADGNGHRPPTGAGETSYAGDCSAPAYMYLAGLPDPVLDRLGVRQLGRVSQHLYVRCRRCPECLRQRGRVWTARAAVETLAAKRTWFGTLTLSPDRATQARYAADRAAPDGYLVDQRPADHFKRMCDHVSPELTRFLKRVRKNSGAAVRYLLVAEAHKSGMPHWHILIHEYAGEARKRTLDGAWRYGFSQFRLVDNDDTRVVRYVTKYLAKDALARIRASVSYGSALPDHITERILSATRTIAEIGRKEYASPREGPPPEDGDGTSHL